MTFPALESQGPTADPTTYPGIDNVTRYREGLLVGYRFYDAVVVVGSSPPSREILPSGNF